ncbi:MAG: hypothetical protein GY864_15335 [Desulfobacterales bacterium]|nr:hypothetical protein [Desulfobacterales bacterium]
MKTLKTVAILLMSGFLLFPFFNHQGDFSSFAGTAKSQTRTSSLVAMDDNCTGLIDELKNSAIHEMEKRVDANLELALEYGSCFYYGGNILSGGGSTPSPPSSGYGPDATAAEGAQEYSETNTQVTGVDEADFVKNDGSHIYILADGRFQIIDTWPPESLHEVSSIEIEGQPKKMFMHKQRAFIYSSLEYLDSGAYYYSSYSAPECTYGYNCDFTGDGREAKITIIDISNLAEPVIVREIFFSGSYINSRRIQDAVHSAIFFPSPRIEGIRYWPDGLACGDTDEEISAMFAALKQENRALIDSADITEWFPSFKEIRYVDGQAWEALGIIGNCSNYYVSSQETAKGYISIISMEIDGSDAFDATTVVGSPGAVYASSSALYLSSRHRDYGGSNWFFVPEQGIEEATTIHKFNLDNEHASSSYAGSGVVKGGVLNQFSMDEHEGFFRIATTTGHVPSPNVHSIISVLEDSNGELKVVGSIDEIAPTEDIRSARFFGDRGFIVTFKKTDPLFALDLTDPFAPKIAGELKIPGFSTYMHYMDENHLLTIGYDAEEHDNFAYFQGIMLQIFDVSDMANPSLAHKEVIGTRGTTSDAATNHLAFNYFTPRGKNWGYLALPMNVCEDSGGGGSYGDIMTFSGLMVYKASTQSGFEVLGGVSHVAPETDEYYRNSCYNWWTDSNSYVKRSIFMDEYVFSITEDSIKANLIWELGEDVAEVSLAASRVCSYSNVGLCTSGSDCLDAGGTWQGGSCGIMPVFRNLSMGPFNIDPDCIADYDFETGELSIPCIELGADLYKADLLFTIQDNLRLKLIDVNVSTSFNNANWHPFAAAYWEDLGKVFIPYVDFGDFGASSLEFYHVPGEPSDQSWVMELVDYKEIIR